MLQLFNRGSRNQTGTLLGELVSFMEHALDQDVTSAVVPEERPMWLPLPGPQTAAYLSEADELFYGGGGGGGKTDLVLGLATTKHHSSIIFRREMTQLRGPEGIVERSRQIIGMRGRLNENLLIWRGLPDARQIEFGGVKDEASKNKYKGRAHDFKGFDELPEFSEGQYRFLIAWLRTTIPGQRTRVVGTGNPPTTPEGEWVNRYWAPWLDPRHPNPAMPGELRWFVSINGVDTECPSGDPVMVEDRLVRPRSRTFIPASLEDNPYLLKSGYADVLDNLPEPLRSQMRFGDFAATQTDDQWQVIPTEWVRQAQARWRERDKPKTPMSAAGVDPARGGPDKFTIAPRYDNWLAPIVRHQGSAAPDGAAGAKLIVGAIGMSDVPVLIDVGGQAGSSAYDHYKTLGTAIALNGSEASTARDKSGKLGFFNKRAEWHWLFREALDPTSGQDIALPPDPELLADLCAPRWRPTPRGIQVEKKEDIKQRIGRSPDAGESCMYAFVQTGFLGNLAAVIRMGEDASTGMNSRKRL
jgi:hypothetical protein